MTTTFYAPPASFRGNQVVLPEDEARHAVRALRMSAGDQVIVVDGAGGRHRVRLDHVSRRQAAGTVIETLREIGESPYHLTIAMALLKNRNRFETVLEKATELGVGRIIPLITDRTQKETLRRERSMSILVAAMKQSGRSRLVVLDEPQLLEEVVASSEATLKLVCAMGARKEDTLLSVVRDEYTDGRIQVLIGPEGGFTPHEVEALTGRGYRAASLGRRRLRAETAAITVAAGVMLALGC